MSDRPLAAQSLSPVPGASAFVRISPRDPRYFELSNGQPYIPIGMNLVEPPHGTGLADLVRPMASLAQNSGNYCRFWLGSWFFDVESTRSGEFDEARATRIDEALDAAGRHGLRVKMCIDQFRQIGSTGGLPFEKPVHHVSRGGPAVTTADFFDTPAGRKQFTRKLAWYADRYGNDPRIFGWELWNEVDCIESGDWLAWTREMLGELRRRFPLNLAMQSLGSLDRIERRGRYRSLCAEADNQVVQVHRYLDLNAQLEECRGPVDVLAASAVAEVLPFADDRPVLLSECGAVEPGHAGPFRLYERDRDGIILHDVLFAPFMRGAAGPGQPWHWDLYVDRMRLWHHFGRFARAVAGIDPPAERFETVSVTHPSLRVLALVGRRTTLAWCRDSRNTWQTELEQQQPPQRLSGVTVALPGLDDTRPVDVRVYDPWVDRWSSSSAHRGQIALPDFSRSIVVRVERRQSPEGDAAISSSGPSRG